MGATSESFINMLNSEDYDARPPIEEQKGIQSWRKPSLTMDQFEKSRKGTKNQIQNVLSLFRMSINYRRELKRIIK